MNKIKTVFKIVFFILYFVLLTGVFCRLFFEDQFNSVLNFVKSFNEQISAREISIGYSEPLISLSPLANDVGSRERLAHLYEGLVRTTADLKVEPALAISYGAIDNLTWEFRLRPGVFFHTGEVLTVDDVVYSLTEAKNNHKSHVKDIASTIREIQKIDEEIFRIQTVSPDPLLLSKLSLLYVFKPMALASSDGGTGPYLLQNKDRDILILDYFDRYWGKAPSIKKVFLKTFATKKDKLDGLKNQSADIIPNVPPDVAKNFNVPGFSLKTMPSLEVNFLMFNFDGLFKEKALREAVVYALRADELTRFAQGFATPIHQFVGDGIFGYDPNISKRYYDKAKAQQLVVGTNQTQPVLATFDLPKGLEMIGAKIKEHLHDVGIDLRLNFVSQSELNGKITNKKSEFFFFGWRNELGDAGDFLSSVVHTSTEKFGVYNGANYSNSTVDRLIEESQGTVNAGQRLVKLRQIMRIITVDDIVGVPLFSPDMVYAVSDGLKWQPRVDGYVLAQEIKL